MNNLIKTIRLGTTNCYLIKNKEIILIDAGIPRLGKRFVNKIKRLGIKPNEIKLLIITHGHFDHMGSAKEIKDITGCKLAIHDKDADALRTGKSQIPKGLTFLGKLLRILIKPLSDILTAPAVEPDIILKDEYSLEEFGINGKIIHTPGHSPGSVSVVLAGGEAFVGNLIMNRPPFRFTPGIPHFGDNVTQIYNSWRKVITSGAKIIYPAHGKSFPAKILEEKLTE